MTPVFSELNKCTTNHLAEGQREGKKLQSYSLFTFSFEPSVQGRPPIEDRSVASSWSETIAEGSDTMAPDSSVGRASHPRSRRLEIGVRNPTGHLVMRLDLT